MIQTQNNYQKEVFNGDIGRVADIDQEEQELIADFDGRRVPYDFSELDELAHAFACSIHKSQGSEYPAVVIPLHTQHYIMLQRNLLYTGVTRGRKLVALVGSRKALAIADAETGHGVSLFHAPPTAAAARESPDAPGEPPPGGPMTRRTRDDWQSWLDEFSRGDQTEAWRGIMCFLRWFQIRADNEAPNPELLPAIEGDIFHSHLLRRMLGGKEPLEAPPPENFGQPWYDLVENGRGIATEVLPWEWAPEQKISINQGIWTILEKKSTTRSTRVTYRLNPSAYRLLKQADGNWLLETAGRDEIAKATLRAASSRSTPNFSIDLVVLRLRCGEFDRNVRSDALDELEPEAGKLCRRFLLDLAALRILDREILKVSRFLGLFCEVVAC